MARRVRRPNIRRLSRRTLRDCFDGVRNLVSYTPNNQMTICDLSTMKRESLGKCKRAVPRTVAFILIAFALLLGSTSAGRCGDEDFITMTAGNVRWYPDKSIIATGGVQAKYRDLTVECEEAQADLQTNIAVFRGNVRFSTADYSAIGELLTLNMKTREWVVEKASSVLQPGSLQGRLLTDAFLQSASLSGSDEYVKVTNGTFTTCGLEKPHYLLEARQLDIYPDSKIVARRVSFVGLGNRLFTVNSLVIPIRGFGQTFVPEVGSSAEEGTFVKGAYAYRATKNEQGFVKLDLMSKKGVGTGIEHTYKGARSGIVSLYYLYDQEVGSTNLTSRFQHQQSLGTLNLSLSADYRRNNYLYYPGTTSQNSEITLSHHSTNSSTSLAYRYNTSQGMGDYSSYTTSFRHTQTFSPRLNVVLSTDLRTYNSSGFASADREMESGIDMRYETGKYGISLIASKRFDLDGSDYTGDDFYSSLDRLPEISLETDTFRSGIKSPFGFPARLKFSLGRYHEEPSGVTRDRFLFDFDLIGKTLDFGSRNELTVSGGFRQALYASDMAQFVTKTNMTLTSRFSDYMKGRILYNYQQPKGFSPFRFDYAGDYNYMRAVLDYQDKDILKWSLSTGYDFRQDKYPWHDLTLRLSARPANQFGYSIATGYNLNSSRWRSLVTRVQVGDPNHLALDLGSRYNLEEGKFDLVRSRFDVPLGKNWKVDGLIGWNGLEKRFDYRAIRITRDLHCWEASLIWVDEMGFRNDKGLRLDLRLKAFPVQERFGIGQYGQVVDTSMGEFYY